MALTLDEGRLRVVHACWAPEAIAQLPDRLDTPERIVLAHGGGVPSAVHRIVARGLQGNPDERWPTMAAVAGPSKN